MPTEFLGSGSAGRRALSSRVPPAVET